MIRYKNVLIAERIQWMTPSAFGSCCKEERYRDRYAPCLAFCIMFLLLTMLAGCGNENRNIAQKDSVFESRSTDIRLENRDRDISSGLRFEYSMEMEYAEEFVIDYYQDQHADVSSKDEYALISVADGGRYLVVPEGKEVPQDLAADIIILQQPLTNIYLVASAAMDMVCKLKASDAIRFSGQKIDGWCIEEAREAMEKGNILYAGKYSAPDYERIVSEGCSLAIENNMITHSPEVIEKLQSFGIPVVIDRSSYESHPLGRVEWIKFYGTLLKREEEADLLFKEQVDILQRVTAEEASGKTVAFFYITTNGMVNVRRTSDYVPKMIELAGGRYIFDHLEEEESKRSTLSMQMEAFYKMAKDADYLIYNSTIDGELTSVDELIQKEKTLKDFKAVQEGNVWCTTRDLYQQSMSVGGMIEDIHSMLTGEEHDMLYMYPLSNCSGSISH